MFRKERATALEPELERVRAEFAHLDKREKELREQLLKPQLGSPLPDDVVRPRIAH